MAEDDDHESTAQPDQDRAAILARRQRFIAFALSGLATTACTDGSRKADDGKAEESKKHEVPPQPCLSPVTPDPPPPPEVVPPTGPKVCLKIAEPEPEPPTPLEPEPIVEPEPEVEQPVPKPCLSKPAPCLRKASPKPCLKTPVPDE